MKNLKMFFLFILCLQSGYSQWCEQPNPDFCPGNYFTNGDFEILTGDPNSETGTDIGLATGWSAMWSGLYTMADLACGGTIHNPTSDWYFVAPTPNTGVYAGAWIDNGPEGGNAEFREGMFNELTTPILQNSGIYSFNFNIAIGIPNFNSNKPTTISVYGVYNPNNEIANPPTGRYIPLNVNLWSNEPSVEVVLLGTVNTPNPFTNTWITRSVTFDSSILPDSGITHIMIMPSNAHASNNSKQYVNFDEFCLQYTEPSTPVDNSSYCCNGDNLIENGNFENGDIGFSSNYTSNSKEVNPNEYAVINSNNDHSICINWNIEDHTLCESDKSTNNQVLVVNGRTQQFSNSTIWMSSAKIEPDAQYKFCAYVKHLPQCCFDITPKIRIEYRQLFTGSWIVMQDWTSITQNDSNAPSCNWEQIGGTFTATNSVVLIRIIIDELNNGDGNDLALDDISLMKIPKADINIEVTENVPSDPLEITASINSIANTDDYLPNDDCEYLWAVVQVTDIFPTVELDWLQSYNNVWFGGSYAGHTWGLTTDFSEINIPGNGLYRVYLWVQNCGCWADTHVWEYSGGGIGFKPQNEPIDLKMLKENIIETEEEKAMSYKYMQWIKENINNPKLNNNLKQEFKNQLNVDSKIQIYPNPFTNQFRIAFDGEIEKVTLYDSMGRNFTSDINQHKEGDEIVIDGRKLPSGVYFVKIEDQNEFFSKIIKINTY